MEKMIKSREVYLFVVEWNGRALSQQKTLEHRKNKLFYTTTIGGWQLTVQNHLAEDAILLSITVECIAMLDVVRGLGNPVSPFGDIVGTAEQYIRDGKMVAKPATFPFHRLVPVNRAVTYLFPRMEIAKNRHNAELKSFFRLADARWEIPYGILLDKPNNIAYMGHTLAVNMCGPEYVEKSGMEEAIDVYNKVCKQ